MNKNELFKNVCIAYIVFYAIMFHQFVNLSKVDGNQIVELIQIWISNIIPPSLILSFIRFFAVKKWVFPFIADKFVISDKFQFGARKRRIPLVAKQLFKCILLFYLHWNLGINALKKVDWVPSPFMIGGTTEPTQGIVHRLISDPETYHHLNLPHDIQLYFNVLTAYHLHQTGWLFAFEMDVYNFWEMLLHHVVTLSLIVLCFITKHTALGALVVFLHGISDIPVVLCKIASNTSSKVLQVLLYVAMVTIFPYFRVFVFVSAVIWPVYIEERRRQNEQGGPYTELMCHILLLSTLVFLHVFWTGLMIRIGHRLITTGKANDDHAKRLSSSESEREVEDESQEKVCPLDKLQQLHPDQKRMVIGCALALSVLGIKHIMQ